MRARRPSAPAARRGSCCPAQRAAVGCLPAPQVYQSPLHSASVNSLCWAPYELGLVLAAASSDGSLSILTYQPDGSWHADKVWWRCCSSLPAPVGAADGWVKPVCSSHNLARTGLACCASWSCPSHFWTGPCAGCTAQIDGAHPVGCTAVSWAPAAPKGSLVASKAPGQPVRRLASSGADNCVKVWGCGCRGAAVRRGRQRCAGPACGMGEAHAHALWSRALMWNRAVSLARRCQS